MHHSFSGIYSNFHVPAAEKLSAHRPKTQHCVRRKLTWPIKTSKIICTYVYSEALKKFLYVDLAEFELKRAFASYSAVPLLLLKYIPSLVKSYVTTPLPGHSYKNQVPSFFMFETHSIHPTLECGSSVLAPRSWY